MLGSVGALALWIGVLAASTVRYVLLCVPIFDATLHRLFEMASATSIVGLVMLGLGLFATAWMVDIALRKFNVLVRVLSGVAAALSWTVAVVIATGVVARYSPTSGEWDGFTAWLPF